MLSIVIASCAGALVATSIDVSSIDGACAFAETLASFGLLSPKPVLLPVEDSSLLLDSGTLLVETVASTANAIAASTVASADEATPRSSPVDDGGADNLVQLTASIAVNNKSAVILACNDISILITHADDGQYLRSGG